MSAAIRNSTARCCCATAARISSNVEHRRGRLAGLAAFPMRSWSRGILAAPSSSSGARPDRPGPDRAASFRAYPHPPVPDEPAIASVRAAVGRPTAAPYSPCRSASISTGGWPSAKTPWDAHPNTTDGKMDAETRALRLGACKHPDIKCAPDPVAGDAAGDLGGPAAGSRPALSSRRARRSRVSPKLVILAAGAVQSAVLLLRSADGFKSGLANSPIRSAATS
jgi:choline dehydrogenase-like flavoprotein